jgi:methionine-rich copper-binding protein CopC
LNCLLFLLAVSTSTWGQFFESPPRIIDDANEDTVFSPNGDGVQDNLIISFVTNGFTGDYRIMIDVHGPGAVGRPDGVFDIDDDWVVLGAVGPGPSEFYPENNPKIIHQEWDGTDRAPSQDAPPSARPVRNGNYEIRVETDAFEDGAIDIINPTYQSSTLVAVVDIDAPQISSTASHLFFSPNGDAIKDTTTITYALSEHLSDLRLEFSNFENQPAIKLTQITRGRQSFTWSGLDGLRTPLIDGVYNLRLHGVDNGGNVTTFDVGAVQIDTKAPTFTQITPSRDAYLKTSIAAIEVEFNLAEQDSPINFDSSVTTIGLQDAGGETVSGIIRSDVTNNRLTLALDNPLDTISENGTYTAVILVADEAGNQAATESSFNFDTVPPTLQRIRSNYGNFPPNGSVNTKITFVEVDLDDNIDDGLNLAASTIALNGPNGAIFGNQTFGGDSTLRWSLEAPIAADGSEDGIYTITISVADRAGNTANFGEISFVYDTQAPRLDSLTPNLEDSSFHLGGGTVYRSQPLLQVVAGFDDGAGSGVDFASSRLEIVRLDETESGNIFLTGTRHVNPTDGTLAFLLSEPLENQDGTQDGAYTIHVSSADVAGNTSTSRVDLIYDTEAPTIVSVAPERDATVTTLSQVTLVMDDSMSGVDFANTILKLVRDDVEIRGTSSNNGKDTEVLTLSNPLVTDGSDDGEYRIEITTVDRAGNASDLIERRFYFVSQPPEIRLNAPATGVINEFTTIDSQLVNYIGTGIDFSPEKSSMVVTRPDGTVLPSASVEADNVNNRLVWMAKTPLPRDGSADGEYTVSVNYENFVGQNFTQDFALIFDTQLPRIAQTTPAPGARVSRLGTVTVEFTADLSGVDFAGAQVRLLDPNGATVGTNRSDNGVDVITLRVQDIQTSTTEGIYTIEVTPADRAGNVADSPYLSSFTFAPREPSITLEPTDNAPTNQLRQITATLQDYVGPGIDFGSAETSISVRDALGSVVTAQPIQPNAAELQLTWTVLSPLPRDGSADGTYEVMARFVESPDLVTTSPTTFERSATLVFDTQPAHILSTNPTRNARITHLEHATIELGDDLSGVDFNNTLIQLVDPSNNSIPTNISNDGEKRITLSFDAFKTDGSADGVYRLEITPVDLAGNVGGLSTVEFVYATLAPEIEMLTPADESVVNRVPEIRALIHDHSGEGINLKKSMISLSGPDGADVRGVPGDDEERTLTLRLGLPTDGSADGTYTVNLNLVDNLGIEAAYMRHFTYDSVPPKIVTESLPPRENVIDDHRIIVEFEVADASPALEAGSGVDFDATSVQLQDSNGELIAGDMKDDGVSVITFTSAELASVGVYTLTIVVADRAGNLSVPQQFTYRDVILPPRVVSFSPAAKSRLNRLTEISAVIEDQSGRGIDFSPAGSTVELRSPDDVVVEGNIINDGVDTITLRLLDPLLTDGSDDGVYVITVQPVDQRGISGEVRQYSVTYDTQKPRVQSVSHIDLTANVSNVRDSVRRVEVELIETGSGIDFERSYVQLWRHTEDERALVPGTLDNDGSLLWLQLENALARNGVDDSAYSVVVSAVDNADNVEEKEFVFLYDTQVPGIDSVKAAAAAGNTLEIGTGSVSTVVGVPIHQIHLAFSDGSGSGIDVSQTTAQLIQPDGTAVAATQQDDGMETVSLRFKPLRNDGTDDGRYFVRVTPIDFSGNTYTSPIEFQFLYSTRKPEVVSTTPAEHESVNFLDSVSVVLIDHSGEGIDFDRSTVGLYNAEGILVEGRQNADTGSSAITWDLDRPMSRDGVDDGEHSIRLIAFDGAGNELSSSTTILYDSQIPRIVSVSADTIPSTSIPANELVVLNRSFSQMRIELSDEHADGEKIPTSGIDFAGTIVQLVGPDNEQIGVTVSDDGETQLIVNFTPLVEPGAYTLEIIPRDLAGNASGHPIQYKFSLNLAKPRVDSLAIGGRMAPVAFVNQLDKITAKLVDPNGVGLDLTTGGSGLSVIGPNGVVDGLQEGNGVDELEWTPLHLPEDGTADGRYTVTITPVDNLGLSGAPARYEFILDTQQPELVGVDPIDLTHAVSYIGGQIFQISAQVGDVGPSGLDISTQTITLQDSNGVFIPADLTTDGDSQILLTLVQPLATNGDDDGEYSIVIDLSDRAGNTFKIEHTFVYDTQAPTLVDTDPAGDLIRDDLTSIVAHLSDNGGSGIDFAVSQLMLFDPNGNQVNGQLGNDGAGQLILLLDELAEDGSYRIRVVGVDRAGNGTDAPFERTFLFSTNLPTVVSTVPVTAPAGSAFTRTPPGQVEVEFQSSPNLSTVKLIHPNGTTVPGQQIRDGNRLVYRLSRELASDGSDDGSYVILVTPVNSAGRSGEQQQYSFVYDSVVPEVEGILPVVESPGVNNALNEILVLVTDASPSSSIDWDELDDSWVTFEKIGVDKKIRGRLTTDRDQLISFHLESPLASDGSQDGKYRVIVMPRDRAGNVAIPTAIEFFLDTRPPTIHTDSLLINDRPLFVSTNHPDYPSADGSGSGVVIQARMSDVASDGEPGLGVDLSQSSIVVTAPDDTPVTGNLIQNGTDTIVFRSGPLIAEGFYRVEITSVGLDVDGLGFAPTGSITTQFLHETTEPVAELTDFGGKTSLTDQALPLRGTATDPISIAQEGIGDEQGGPVSASGIAFVEIVGTGPDGEPIEPVLAVDRSGAQSEPWSSWSLDFLPARSGGYNLDVRVTDRAGNVAVYDGVTVNLSVSLTYRGTTYSWPSPLKRSTGDRAHFSFDVNIPSGSKINMTLSIYDFGGDLVFEDTFANISPGRDSDQLVTWNLKNQAGAAVARGIYIFRLEAEDVATKNRSNAVGKMLVIE